MCNTGEFLKGRTKIVQDGRNAALFGVSSMGNMGHVKLYAAVLTLVMFVIGHQSLAASSGVSTGPFRLAVSAGNWVEYVVSKSVNAEKICFTFAPGGSGSIISKPLYEGDRIRIVVKYLATGQGKYYFNSTTFYVTEGSALSDLYLNGQLLWDAQGSMNDYRPMGLDFHYVVGDGYWDTLRARAPGGNYSVTVADRNVTISYMNNGGGWVHYIIKVDGNTGVVLESSRTYYTSSIGDTSVPPQGECLLRIVDTNIAGILPTVSRRTSTISCSISSNEVIDGNSITVSGSIDPAVAGKTVTLTYSRPDGSTFNRAVTSGSDGKYGDICILSGSGTWNVKAK